jgi:hypothetical protein
MRIASSINNQNGEPRCDGFFDLSPTLRFTPYHFRNTRKWIKLDKELINLRKFEAREQTQTGRRQTGYVGVNRHLAGLEVMRLRRCFNGRYLNITERNKLDSSVQ